MQGDLSGFTGLGATWNGWEVRGEKAVRTDTRPSVAGKGALTAVSALGYGRRGGLCLTRETRLFGDL